MHAAGFGLSPPPQFAPQYPGALTGMPGAPAAMDPAAAAAAAAAAGQPGGMGADPAQIQQLVQLLGAKMLPKQTAVVECPKSMVGRVIGKGGETIKSLQQYTGAMIQIDQSTDPTRVTIAGSPQSLQLAVSMVNDIVRGTFKGFAMLRQIALSASQPGMPGFGQPQPVYVQGYGFVPPSQVYNPDDPLAAAQMLRSSPPTGPLTPPMTPLRGAGGGAGGAGLAPDALAALLGQQQGVGAMPGMPMGAGSSQDALLGQLLGQLASQPQAPHTMGLGGQHGMMGQAPVMGMPQGGMQQAGGAGEAQLGGGLQDPAAIQALLAQAGLLAGGGGAQLGGAPHPSAGLPPSSGLMLSASGAPVMVSAGMPAASGTPASPSLPAASVALSAGSASPAHSLSVPVSGPTGAASIFNGLAAAAANNRAASYLGTSPTATHSSAGDTGSGRTSPAAALASANPALITRRPGSDTGSPLGRYGAVGSPSSQGAASSGIGAAAEEALSARMAGLATRDLAHGVPAAAPATVSVAEGGVLPPGWAKVTDGQGLVYYVNSVTQESSLTRPTAQGQAAM